MPESPVTRRVQALAAMAGRWIDLRHGPGFGSNRMAQSVHPAAQLGKTIAVLAHLWSMHEGYNGPRSHI
jgi:hypothetical protein